MPKTNTEFAREQRERMKADPKLWAKHLERQRRYAAKYNAKKRALLGASAPKPKPKAKVKPKQHKKPVYQKKGPRPVNYLNNRDLLADVIESKKQGKMTEELGKKLLMLVRRYATKGNWNGYTFNEEMQSEAVLNLCSVWDRFDETKYENAFAYYTQAIKNSFIQILRKEKTYRNIKDALRVNAGLPPSDSYAEMIKGEIDAALEVEMKVPE